MKYIFKIALLFCVIFASCSDKKTESKNNIGDNTVSQEIDNSYQVNLEIFSKSNDAIAVYYTEDNTINFTDKLAIWAEIIGNSNFQEVKVVLPEDTNPTHLRLDLGNNKSQDEIQIGIIEIKRNNNSLEIKPVDFFKYFANYQNFDAKLDTISNKIVIKNDVKDFKTPFFYPTEELVKELLKI